MNLRLNQIRIESFKGIHQFSLMASGCNATVTAANGIGKTTIYDAFLWVLFGKDSTGRKEFELWPLDDENQRLRGLEVKVEVDLDIDEQKHTFRKELHEKFDKKGEVKGHETFCWIDDVAKKVGEYEKVINALVNEDTFKALTDLTYVCAKLNRQERRRLLLAIAGQIGTPKGFASLLSALNGRTLEEYKKVLSEQKARYEKEQKDIGPRIDELQRGLNGYAEQDTSSLQTKRSATQKALAELDEQRKHLLSDEKARQQRLDALNKLTVAQLHRATQIRIEMRETKALLEEKGSLYGPVHSLKNELGVLDGKARLLVAENETLVARIRSLRQPLQVIREDCTKLMKAPESEAVCFNCGQPLPAAMRESAEADRKRLYAEKVHSGNELKRQIESLEAEQAAKQEQIAQVHADGVKQANAIDKAQAAANKRLAEIDALLANPPEPDYAADAEWSQLQQQIENAKAEIGDPVAEQLEALESRKAGAQAELDRLNAALNQADRAVKDRQRIAELGVREQELAQKIADCDRQLAEIRQYNLEQAKLVEEAINGKFQYVTWKLFDYYLNGDIDDRLCEAVYQGVPYSDLSTGQQIRVGIDIVNVLAQHYGVSVPLFVDHAESLTYPLETTTQTICLRAVDGVDELTVAVEERKAVAA